MKKLICAKDVETLAASKKTILYTDADTIVTPSAQDAAKVLGITFASEAACVKPATDENPLEGDNAVIYKVLKVMMEQGLLEGLLDLVEETPYTSDKDSSGLKVVHGKSVKLDVFDTGNANNKVYYQELISKEESLMSAGFLTIEKSSFDWELFYEEIDIVLEGTINITINGKTYTAEKGDILYVPKDSKVIWGAKDYAKLFYVTYPANWSDYLT